MLGAPHSIHLLLVSGSTQSASTDCATLRTAELALDGPESGGRHGG